MENLNYTNLEIQKYFLSDEISSSQKRMIFRIRTRMENFGENFRGGRPFVMCPLCKLHLDNQDLCLQCPEVAKNIQTTGNIKEIYGENINKEIVTYMTKVAKLRKLESENW